MIKLVIWGFIGLMILPTLVETPSNTVTNEPAQVSNASGSEEIFTTSDAMYMAAGVATYLKDICAHDAKLCENGGRLAHAALVRAKQGAVVLAGMVEQHREKMNAKKDATTTASIK